MLDPGKSLEHKAVERDSSFRIHMALHSLEEPYREVFELRVFGDPGPCVPHRQSVFIMGDTYENADEYTQGETDLSGSVKNLDIHWISGKIRIAYHNDNAVLLRETSKKSISSDMEMRWWLDGDTLRVQYAKSGVRFYGFGSLNLQKELTVTLPESISLNDVSINSTSADIEIPSLKADAVKLAATSGNSQLTLLSSEDTEIGSTSGEIKIELGMLKSLKVNATSGNVTASLPEQPGFTANVHTTSGDVHYTLPMSSESSTYVCGNGSESVEIHTTSGDIVIDRAV